MEFMGYVAYGTQDIVMGISAAVASLALFLYPIPTFCRIAWRKSTGDLQPYPYLAMQIASAVWMIYATPGKGETFTFHGYCLYKVNNVGFIFHVVYVYSFLYHSTTTPRNANIIFGTLLGEQLLFGVPVIINHWVNFEPVLTKILGPAFIIFGLIMYASPLLAIIDAYQRKWTNTLPFGLCTMFLLNAVAWFSYTFFYPPTRDYYVAIAHGCGIVLGVGQLILCFVFNAMLRNSGAITEDSITEDSTPLLNDIP